MSRTGSDRPRSIACRVSFLPSAWNAKTPMNETSARRLVPGHHGAVHECLEHRAGPGRADLLRRLDQARCARQSHFATAPSRTPRTRSATVAQNVRTNFLNVTSGIAQVHALEQAQASTQRPARLHHPRPRRGRARRERVDVLNASSRCSRPAATSSRRATTICCPRCASKPPPATLTDLDVEQVNRTLARGGQGRPLYR